MPAMMTLIQQQTILTDLIDDCDDCDEGDAEGFCL